MGVLTVDHVEYLYRNAYQTVKAVNGVSFDFEPGCLYAVAGASGSGKTTFLSLLAGLDVPSEGRILFHGVSMTEMDRDEYRRDHVSVIYQNYNLFQHLTVLENAAYPLYLKKEPKREADAAAREKLLSLGLKEEQFGRLPNMLSGGEQQRVAVARALVCGSEIILADEPTGNLDSENTKIIVELFQELAHREGRCVILVTHDPEVSQGADVVLHMRDGKLAREAS